MMFRDRHHAGQVLAECLRSRASCDDAVVLALPSGGVAVGTEVALALQLPFDVLVARRLPVPGHPELTMGAIACDQVRVIDEDVVERHGIDADILAGAEASALVDLERDEHVYHDRMPGLSLAGKPVLLVDDGCADASMLLAAIGALRLRGPARIVLAVPVAGAEIRRRLGDHVDEIVCACAPAAFGGSSCWYADVGRTSDREVLALLGLARDAVHQAW